MRLSFCGAFCRQQSLCPGDQHLKGNQTPRGPIKSPPPTAGAAPITSLAAACSSSQLILLQPSTPNLPVSWNAEPLHASSSTARNSLCHYPNSSDSSTALALNPGKNRDRKSQSKAMGCALQARGGRTDLALTHPG